jgi:hypothetical protein
MSKRSINCRRKPIANRRGLMSIEVVTSIAVMLPICGALFFTGIKIWQALYQTIGTLVSWPFL